LHNPLIVGAVVPAVVKLPVHPTVVKGNILIIVDENVVMNGISAAAAKKDPRCRVDDRISVELVPVNVQLNTIFPHLHSPRNISTRSTSSIKPH
jgi:hypothetical protein